MFPCAGYWLHTEPELGGDYFPIVDCPSSNEHYKEELSKVIGYVRTTDDDKSKLYIDVEFLLKK